MHLRKRISVSGSSLGATTFSLPWGIPGTAGLEPGWTRDFWVESLKGFPACRTAEKEICSRKIHWGLSSMARSPLAWEAFEAQAAGGCGEPQMHHQTLGCSHTPPPTRHWRQGRSVTFGSEGGLHRPVTTDEVDQRSTVSQPGKALRAKQGRGNLSKPLSTKQHCQNCQGGSRELDYFCKSAQKT